MGAPVAGAPTGRRGGVLGPREFAALLGVAEGDLPERCRTLIGAADFRYEILADAARDAVLLRVLRTLEGALAAAGPTRLGAWEEGWSDVLARFEASGGDPRELWPHYLRPAQRIVRLAGEYVLPASPEFEGSFVRVVQAWFALTFLREAPTVYEFGCGPGHNLVAFAELDRARRYVGLDWATASQRLLGRVAAALDLPIEGRRLDMRDPAAEPGPEAGAGVVTFGALEQLGADFEPFLGWLLAARPRICVHLEPIHELYDPDCLFDFVAARYHERRGYLRGYLTRLRALERRGEVEILHLKKCLGSFYHDGWVALAWRPRAAHDGGA
jgi:SAM-dependent methyltransferase